MNALPVARWLLVCLALCGAGAPVAALLFRRFPDRGAALALPTAIATATLVAYWVGKVWFGPGTVAVAALAVLALGLLAYRRGGVPEPRGLAAAMAVFVAGFLLVVAVKAVFPDVTPHGGEKFLDYALLNAVHAAERLPPPDPWFAGERVRYYYGGYVASALLAHLSGVELPVAFNLAVATFYGLLASAAYGLVGAIAAEHGRSRRVGGALGAFFVALGGPLAVPVRLLFGLLPRDLALEYGHAVFAGIRKPYPEAFAVATDPFTFDAWSVRYVIPGTADVFPLWTFLNGDLRAHMVSAPFLVLLAACWYAYHLTPPGDVRRRRLLAFGAVPAVGGLLALVSTWTLPTTWGLSAVALALADGSPLALVGVDPPASRARREVLRPVSAGGLALVVALLAAALAAPMLLFHTPQGRGVGFLPERSDAVPFLLVHGCFLALFATHLAGRIGLTRRRAAATGALVVAAGAAAFAVDAAAVAFVGPLLVAAFVARRRDADVGFGGVLVVAGAGLVLAPEFLYPRVWPYNNPRWNTFYKVYHQAWVVWGLAAGVVATRLLGGARDTLAGATPGADTATASPGARRRWLRRAGGVLAAVAVCNAAVFGALALAEEFDGHLVGHAEGPLTIEGDRFVERDHPDEAAAMAWLDERPDGQVLVTTPGRRTYDWRNAPSTFTDHVAVLGWWHQAGYRGPATYERRRESVELVYEGEEPVADAILDHHDVDYVYVGPVERARYYFGNLSSRESLSVAYSNDGVTIYAVDDAVVADATVNASAGVPRLRPRGRG